MQSSRSVEWSRHQLAIGLALALAALGCTPVALARAASKQALPPAPARASLYGRWELSLAGPQTGNPFVDVELFAEFTHGSLRRKVRGFYDGAGTYKVRFMPEQAGRWTYSTKSNVPALDGRAGTFEVGSPEPGNHGPVRVHEKVAFAYADGTPYLPFGTTVYAFVHQELALQETTLRTLAGAPWNKLRLCVFPKWYDYNRVEPPLYPFEKRADASAAAPSATGPRAGSFDLSRPNPAFFALLERRIDELAKLGIEADLILFHPYDENHWGFDRMGREADERYLRYLIARLAAHHNVWWSMANEWDFMKHRSIEDWERSFALVAAEDPYRHLVSIHQGEKWFDQRRPDITHVSVQSAEVHRLGEWQAQYQKPVIDDECEYEGDISMPWGNITARELVHRHWVGFLSGGSVGHGETYRAPDDVLWWARGGVLRGQSPARIAFLRKTLEAGGALPLRPLARKWPFWLIPAARQGEQFWFYFGERQPAVLDNLYTDALARESNLAKDTRWRFEIVDTWDMTLTAVPGLHGGRFAVALPARPGIAIRATPVAAQP